MDDLEFNGTAPLGDEPINEPIVAADAPQPPVNQAPSFYAWSGTQQPVQNAAPRQKESPFANSPYVTAAPEQPPVRHEQPYMPPYMEAPVQPRTVPPAPPKPPKPKKPILPAVSIIACGVVAAVLIGTTLMTNSRLNSMNENLSNRLRIYAQRVEKLEDQLSANQNASASKPQQNPATHDQPVAPVTGMMTPAQVYARCAPSVVAINCTGAAYNGFGYAKTASSGSGFVLSEDGYIVTNYHVVDDSNAIEICMYDGTTYEAKYIGGNEENDIALLKVNATGLPCVTVGISSDLIVGDQVAAIGNPLGELAATLTVGYISAKDRIVTSEGTQINMLQTDAAINPGNSGGPLFNMYGEVIGITSAKYSGTTTSGATIEGIGFAIPTDDVMMMLEDLKNFGHVTGGYLGVTITEVAQETSQLYGLPQGLLVRDVMPGSCAEKAGIRAQDIIINLGDNEITTLNSLSRALNKYKAGQEVVVTVYRSGRELDLTVILDERPLDEETSAPQATEPDTGTYAPWPGDSFFDDWFGQFFG